MGHKVTLIIYFMLFALCSVYGQTYNFSDDRREIETEITDKARDLTAISLTFGLPSLQLGEVNFDDQFFGVNATVNEDQDFIENFYLQLGFKYGLENYLVPGLFARFTINFYSVNVDVDVDATVNGALVFDFDDEFVSLLSIGLVTGLELHLFPFLDYLFETSLPTSWGTFLYTGLRLNYNSFSDDELSIENTDDFVITWEVGTGLEIFFSQNWSGLIEFSLYNNDTSFAVEIANIEVLSGDMDFMALRISIGLEYYF